ncbi:MAG: glycosyl hydrolase [Deltaproteobacteria bacterium]|nr:MAG: glycosyl hydrolase [Deltaproteobacteria bacterium]
MHVRRPGHLLALVLLAGCPAKDDPVEDTGDTLAVGPQRGCDVAVTASFPNASTVEIAGRFNDWTPQAMTDSGGGVWERSLGPLVPGTYGHKFIIDGNWETLPPDVPSTWDDGTENRALRVGDCDRPLLEPIEGSATADGSLTASFQFTRGATGAGLDLDSVLATVGGEPVDIAFDAETGRIDIAVTGLSEGKHSVILEVADTEGEPAEPGVAYLPLWVEPEPFDWEDGVLYFVFTDRFRSAETPDPWPTIPGAIRGTDYMGGDLVGALEAMEEGWFDELGVRTIWLSPVYDNPDQSFYGADGTLYTGYHGYWPIDGRTVEPRWGTMDTSGEQALAAFVDAAHERGMRVVLDTVMNHVHEQHTWIDDHPEWFTASPCVCTTDAGACNWDSNPIGCWFTDYLPDLDYRQQDVVDASIEDAWWWMHTFDIDGFRVDAAKHMDHVAMRTLSMTLRDRVETPGGAEIYLVGETFTGRGSQGLIMDYVAPYELDGQFDFPLYYAIRGAIGGGGGFRTLADEVRAGDSAYGADVHRMSPFMGNHDIERYATAIGGCPSWALFEGCRDVLGEGSTTAMTTEEWDIVNKMSVSWAFTVTQPGPPLLYYGDEIGLAGAGDPDNRRLMPWGTRSMAQQTLLDRLRVLSKLRVQSRALQRGERRELWVDDDLYVYARDAGNGEVAIVALRMGGSTRTESVPIPGDLGIDGRSFTDGVAGSRSFTVTGGNASITLDPWEYAVFLAP